MERQRQIAQILLRIGAVKLTPSSPFTWVSGWRAPIYCDNRSVLAYIAERRQICDAFVGLVREKYPDVEIVVGVATGAIAHAMLVAEKLNLPFAYVREERKDHGLKKVVEGAETKGAKVVVVEDLVSTGRSSLKAIEHLRAEEANVLGMLAIFTYQFPDADKKFKMANCELTTLSNYTALVEQALIDGYIEEKDVELLKRWRLAPDKF